MRRTLALACLLAFASPAFAGLDEGVEAHRGKDYATALTELAPLAESGDARAQYYVGLMHMLGQGVAADPAKGAEYFRRSAEQGNLDGQLAMGTATHNGAGVPQDYAESRRWFDLAAAQGSARAQRQMGLFYLRGQGGPADPAKAAEYFRAAAEQKDRIAQRELGSLYLTGTGVTRDIAEGERLLTLAAERDAEAAFRLGSLREDHYNDWVGAETSYRKAAAGQFAPAMARLSFLHSRSRNSALYAEGHDLALRALEAQPGDAFAIEALGTAELMLGNAERAVELLTQAIAIKGEHGPTHERLGDALAAAGRMAEARAAWERALALVARKAHVESFWSPQGLERKLRESDPATADLSGEALRTAVAATVDWAMGSAEEQPLSPEQKSAYRQCLLNALDTVAEPDLRRIAATQGDLRAFGDTIRDVSRQQGSVDSGKRFLERCAAEAGAG